MNTPKRQVWFSFCLVVTKQTGSKQVVTKQNEMSPFTTISSRHEGEGEGDNEHRCGALDPVTDQNVNIGDIRLKKHDCHMIATTRHSFTVVITTRMFETVNRLVIVTHMFVLENYFVIAEAAFHVEYYSTLIGVR